MALWPGPVGRTGSGRLRILLTGHNGYIGAVLAPMLTAAGHDVTGLDSYWFEDCELYPCAESFKTVRLDIRHVTAAELEGFDAVVHLAALCNDPLGDLNPACTESINYRATERLARLAREAGVGRFIQGSSCSLYGAADDVLIDETAPFNPVSVYGRSKVLAEQALAGLSSDAFAPVFLRFATAYGVSPKLRADLVVNNLVGFAVITGDVLLKSDGAAWRPLIHVEDIARSIKAVCEAPKVNVRDQSFNVGITAENYRVRDIAERVAARVSGSHIRYADRHFADARNYRVSCEKIRAMVPGFEPSWDLERGIDQLARAYRDYAVSYADFTGPRLERLQLLRKLIQRRELSPELLREGGGDRIPSA